MVNKILNKLIENSNEDIEKKSKVIQVILDTNFLMLPAHFKIDIFTEIDRLCDFPYDLVIVDKSVDELKNIIKEQKGKDRAAAELALQLIAKKNINLIKTSGLHYVDRILLELADKGGIIVATQDKALKKALKQKDIKIITLRQKKYLKFEQ